MIIVEYTIDHPLLQYTRERVPDTEIIWEDSNFRPNDSPRFLVQIKSDDYETVNKVLAEDPTVTDPVLLDEMTNSRLYLFEFTSKSLSFALEPAIIEGGGVVEKAIGTNEHWQSRVRFPDRESAQHMLRFCREHDIDITLERVFEEIDLSRASTSGMTEAQRETLIEAVDCGYLEIPRECSLADLGEQLGVSESAASQRFRRGVKNLIQQTR